MDKKTYIYLRVSTSLQDADAQMVGITEYCEKHQIREMTISKDTISGGKTWRDRELWNIYHKCQVGDRIIVSELSRIGRSTADVLDFLAQAVKLKLEIVAVKNNMTFDDSISSKIFSTVLALAAEIERDFIRVRTKEGMENARKKGVRIGRPKGAKSESILASSEEKISTWIKKGIRKSDICRMLECSRGTLDRFITMMEVK